MLDRLSSAIYNNVTSGLGTPNFPLTLDQIKDSIISERLLLINNLSKQNMLNVNDLAMSISCLSVDCESLTKCCSLNALDIDKVRHVEVPQIVNDYGDKSILFVGSADGMHSYTIYKDSSYKYHKYRSGRSKSRKIKPYVWVDVTPNQNNMNDIFIFDAPLVSSIKVVAVFKDPRQLEQYTCCSDEEIYNFNSLEKIIEKNLSNQYIEYYRRLSMPITPNDQVVNK